MRVAQLRHLNKDICVVVAKLFYKYKCSSILNFFGGYLIMNTEHLLYNLLFPFYIGLLPQGMVDNNLWPDHLAGPKADPNYCRQTTNPLIALPLSGSPICAW